MTTDARGGWLGIFDSGLGGLAIARAVRQALPDIDILYYGDTLHLPYGNRSEEAIFGYTCRALDFMFAQGCALVVLACNTASAAALRRIQQEWLPARHPGRNVIGVIVPTLEAAIDMGHRRLGLIATNYSVRSNIYQDELKKLDPSLFFIQKATPLLVPMIENDGMRWAEDVLAHYLEPLLAEKIECLMLGCTHYTLLREQIRQVVGKDVAILSQDDIIPGKLKDYLHRHPEYGETIGQGGRTEFYVSDVTDNYLASATTLYGHAIPVVRAAA